MVQLGCRINRNISNINYFDNGGTELGNIITFNTEEYVEDDSLSMSNGLTDVLIDYLLISGSELADSESEKRMIAFLSEKQQWIIGIGTVGFEIIEMPWHRESFETDKLFLLTVIEYARELTLQESVWDKLGYAPNKENIDYALNGFNALINRMTVNDIDDNNLQEWLSDREKDDPVYCGCPKCPKHGLLMSFFGCKLCNEGK